MGSDWAPALAEVDPMREHREEMARFFNIDVPPERIKTRARALHQCKIVPLILGRPPSAENKNPR
jgi:hypothetical protein